MIYMYINIHIYTAYIIYVFTCIHMYVYVCTYAHIYDDRLLNLLETCAHEFVTYFTIYVPPTKECLPHASWVHVPVPVRRSGSPMKSSLKSLTDFRMMGGPKSTKTFSFSVESRHCPPCLWKTPLSNVHFFLWRAIQTLGDRRGLGLDSSGRLKNG